MAVVEVERTWEAVESEVMLAVARPAWASEGSDRHRCVAIEGGQVARAQPARRERWGARLGQTGWSLPISFPRSDVRFPNFDEMGDLTLAKDPVIYL